MYLSVANLEYCDKRDKSYGSTEFKKKWSAHIEALENAHIVQLTLTKGFSWKKRPTF